MKKRTFSQKCETKTFKLYANRWLNEVASELKPTSYVKYRNIVNLYLLPQLSRSAVKNIGRKQINSLISNLMTSGGARKQGLKASTVNAALTVLKRILDLASQEVGRPAINFRKIRFTIQRPSAPVLRHFEHNRLRNYLLDNLSPCNLGLLLCLNYGLRIGEICALRWNDVDLEKGVLSVNRTLMRKQTFSKSGKRTEVIIASLKSAFSEREIPLTRNDVKILAQNQQSSEAFLLTGQSSQCIEPRLLEYRFKKTLKTCKIKDIKFHSLRHTFATRWIEVGQDVKMLSEILGHSSVNVTLNYYVHPSFENKRNSVENFSKNAFERKSE